MAYLDMSQAQAAAAVGLSQPQFSKRLRGEVDWKLGDLVQLAEVFKIPFTSLVAGLDEKPLEPNGTVEAVLPA